MTWQGTRVKQRSSDAAHRWLCPPSHLLHLAGVEHSGRVLAHSAVDKQLQQLHHLRHVFRVLGVRVERPGQHRELVAEAQQHRTTRGCDVILMVGITFGVSVVLVHGSVL